MFTTNEIDRIREPLERLHLLLDAECVRADGVHQRTGDDQDLEWATVAMRMVCEVEQALDDCDSYRRGPTFGLGPVADAEVTEFSGSEDKSGVFELIDD